MRIITNVNCFVDMLFCKTIKINKEKTEVIAKNGKNKYNQNENVNDFFKTNFIKTQNKIEESIVEIKVTTNILLIST